MKKIIFTAVVLIVTVLALPAVGAFAADTALDDIPIISYYYAGSYKADCRTEYDSKNELYRFYYINKTDKKLICKTKEEISTYCVSGNGLKVFYEIENKIYQYSLKENKVKMIFDIEDDKNKEFEFKFICSSDNGEYCFVYWDYYGAILHNGKSVTTKIDFYNCTLTNSGILMCSIDDGYDNTWLGSFDFASGKKSTIVYFDDEYDIKYFGNIYIAYNSNELYIGKAGSEPKLVYSGELGEFMDFDSKGNAVLFEDDKYVFRIDIKSGKRTNIAKRYFIDSISIDTSNYFIYSEDLDKIVYIDYDSKKLVRLSKWNDKKNSYTQRTETEIIGEKFFSDNSKDLNVILVYFYDDNDDEIFTPLIFENGKLKMLEDITGHDFEDICCDSFGQLICLEEDGLYIINHDGSKEKIFSGETEILRIENGFATFWVSKTKIYNEYGDDCGGTDDIYYIDENGNVILFEKDSKYEIFIVYD